MSRSRARGCFPEDGQPDGCFPEAPAVPARFKCWVEPKDLKKSKERSKETSDAERLLRFLAGERR
jgi:hypothetical protein